MDLETLETKRLLLKGLSPDDMTYIFESYSKEDIKRILGHRSEEDYQKEAFKQKNGYASYNRSFKLFIMTDKSSDTVIGRCGLHNWNVDHRRAELGYAMSDENYKRKGLMTEALEVIIEYGFHNMHLNRMEAIVGATNVPSLKLMEKFSFLPEGILRQHHFADTKLEDSILFSKLYQEYTATQHQP